MSRSIARYGIKYILFYIPAWMAVSFIMMFINYDRQTSLIPQWIGCMIVTGAAAPVCWYTANKLTPRYLYRKKIGLFIGYLLILACLNAILTYLFALFIYHLISGNPVFRTSLYFFSLALEMLLVDVILISVSCIIKIISDRYFMEQQLLQIEKEKVSTELNFLRSQVNPHFLFNVMNTIYFQIDKTNTEARLSVEKLSEMLRYQLYECTSDKIEIYKELHYIQNYVAIQTLRMEKDSDIRLIIDHDMENFLIAPLLILPIVENAFKHVSNFKEPGKNKIYLTVKKHDKFTMLMEAENTYDQSNVQKHLLQTGGLGIQNLKRRLELLYPDKYELNINKGENIFNTTLKLQYND
jgi:two-component system LytT family sensor kinase